MPRFAALGVQPVFQPLWAWADPYIRDLTWPGLGPERSARLYPIGELGRAGATLAFGSDWSVSTLDPLDALELALTRRDPDGDGADVPLAPDQAVDVQAAFAAYTRGSARLVAGEARVALGETFAWVTNPDVGLTAHVTPVGAWSDLYVAEKSTREIVVRSRAGAPDAAFDYVVYGLRIGFEEISIVQEKDHESFIPSMADHRALYERQPDLRRFSALERHLEMEREVRGVATIDLSGAAALKAAVQEYDPALHGPVANLKGRETGARLAEPAEPEAGAAPTRPVAPEPAAPR